MGLLYIFVIVWSIDFGIALIVHRHFGLAGGEGLFAFLLIFFFEIAKFESSIFNFSKKIKGRRGLFDSLLRTRQQIYVGVATTLQLV